MQTRLLLCLALLFSVFRAVAQDDSPYARFGYEGKVLRTPQERQQRMMLLVPNPDTASAIAKVGLDPANQRYYLFDKQNQVLTSDTLASTTVSRFLSTDPLTRSYPHLTPYQFASNTPIQAIDLDGLEAVYYGSQATSGYDLADINHDGKVTKLERSNHTKVLGGIIAAGAIINGGIIAGPSILLRIATSSTSRYVLTSPTVGIGIAGTIASVFDPNPASDYPGLGDEFAKGARFVFGYRWGRRAVELTIEAGADFANQSEKAVTRTLLEEGKSVFLLKKREKNGVTTPDALVDGVATEFKSLQNVNMGGVDPGGQIKKTLEKAIKKQASNVILDARGFEGASKEFMSNVLDRLEGALKGKNFNVRVIGDGYDLSKVGQAASKP